MNIPIRGKGVFLLLILISLTILFSFASVSAAVNETEQVNMAYNWLSSTLNGKWQNLSVEDISYGLLALSYDDVLATQGKNALDAKSNASTCWPASGCKVKDTGLAVLALTKICVDTSKAEEWLMSKNSTPTDLVWYLQIDPQGGSACTVAYDNKEYKITINEDKKINQAAGSCLTLGFGNYWLKIASSCYSKTFTVSCDKDFATTLVYQKQGDSTYYVSSDTKKESSGGAADLKISAICLREGSSCNYESTLLTAVALQQKVDTNLFLPYLIAYADKNTKYLPEAYLFKFTGTIDYADQLRSMQRTQGYWQASTSANGKYYDTALVLNALADITFDNKDRAKTWLLNEQIKTGANNGSWGASRKDTAFILYTIWPKQASCISEGEGGIISCENANGYCVSGSECDYEDLLEAPQCAGFNDVCCKKQPVLKTCSERGGSLCDVNWYCDSAISASDTTSSQQCCVGTCTNSSSTQVLENPCESSENPSYYCSSQCETTDEVDSYLECDFSYSCCKPAGTTTKSSSKLWLIIPLVIILGLVIFLLRGKLGRKPSARRPPTGPPSGPPVMMRPAPPARPMAPMILPRGSVRPSFSAAPRASLRKSATDKELDETLKKLEEISK
ncbi:hypothetical protein HZA33_02210 [Candidatus Pacearchaeota archaeon]|nr:hypothetical protein [Candidatus Pacearchaeota archaeon]